MASRLRDFIRMSPPMFFGSRSDEEPSDFLDEVYNILYAMGMTSIEKAELAAYQLKDVAQTWYAPSFVSKPRDEIKSTLRRKNNEAKKERFYEGRSSKGRLDIHDKTRFKKKFSNQVPPKFPKAHDDRVSNPKSQKGRGTSSPSKKPTCGKCGKKHYGDCLIGMNNGFRCGKSGHKVRDCPNLRGKDKESRQAPDNGSNVDVLKKNHFYALRSRGEQ
ncbi:uncharacterized protein [Solanum lycopersicum]|uniref:uncharacterized protein n=1 Tax=Solanum lycopersicum TaxID=4081 RepID=UPI003748571C